MSDIDHIQSVVVGAGVIGLAIARKLARAGHEVLLLEAEERIAQHTSSRNSQVIHAGMYYPHGTLRARFCVAGKKKLYDYCKTRHVPHDRIEKLIVATRDAHVQKLHRLRDLGLKNGVDDLVLISAEDAKAEEPELACKAALLSPSTGIIDAPAYMMSLLGEAEAAGAFIAYGSPLKSVSHDDRGFLLSVDDVDQSQFLCSNLINAAGLGAWTVAKGMKRLSPSHIPPQVFAKGSYFSLSGVKAPFERLIYPVPDDASLGVHYVRDLGGQVRFGPDLEYLDDLTINYSVDEKKRETFEKLVRLFWPNLPDGALQSDISGIRPRVTGLTGGYSDFTIHGPELHGITGLVNLFAMESPGLTSSLAIADYVAGLVRS